MIGNKLTYFALLWLLVLPLHASSIAKVSVSEVANNSTLIFEGRVSASRAVQKPGSRVIHTLITFEVLDVLKGDYQDSSIELSFLGGSKGDVTMRVTDLHRPGQGERGIYFVENPSRPQVNPLYGWDQGHYLMKYQPKLGRMVMETRSGKAIYAVESKAVVGVSALSSGVAEGISTSFSVVADKPLTTVEFKQRIRGMLQ